VDLGKVVKGALSDCETEIRSSHAHIESIPPWPVVLAHEETLRLVLENLIGNAVKFVTGAPAQISLYAEERPDDIVRIWVEDRGIGIPAEYHERIFQIFQRLHSTAFPGTGIGLAIVRKGVERMGGQVGVVSAPGEGSRFWIDLRKIADATTPPGDAIAVEPSAISQPHSRSSPPSGERWSGRGGADDAGLSGPSLPRERVLETGDSKKTAAITRDPTILLVDDSENDAMLMSIALERAGFVRPLRIVRSGDEAIAYLEGSGAYHDRTHFPMPTAVLLDLNMPGKSGFDVLEWIRRQPILKRLPVHILSASSRKEDIERAYDLGANSYLAKPGTLDGLLEMSQCLGSWLQLNHFAALGNATSSPASTRKTKNPR
jgi:CheY-like chemotaxis protein